MRKVEIFKWLAYDTDFIPSSLDGRFAEWRNKGLLLKVCYWTKAGFLGFQELKYVFGLQSQDLFRHFQITDFCMQDIHKRRDCGMDIFQKTHYSAAHRKIISRLYMVLQSLPNDHTMANKAKWEAEGKMVITQEEWQRIWRQQ